MTTGEHPARPRPRFRTQPEQVPAASDPEALFGELPRSPHAVGPLWSHQADQLRDYAAEHINTPDVALELPTGSGKTLVGLLIAEWRRQAKQQRVAYACPTTQLADQVMTKAVEQGIQTVLMVGSNRSWDPADLARYTRADAVAITTYSAIFNSKSRFADAQTLLFDDAHAAEGFVAEAWALKIERDQAAYDDLFDAFGSEIDQHLKARMTAAEDAAGDRREVRLLPVQAVARRLAEVDAVLATLKGDEWHRYSMIRANLQSCLFYVSRGEFYIRPMIPPTFDHAPFTDPTQRIYLSATLGDAGELERAFGRQKIARVAVPPAWEKAGSGRRFFVFPELALPAAEDADQPSSDLGLAGDLLDLADKRLILAPEVRTTAAIADALSVPSAERFNAKDKTGLKPFLEADKGTLLAANRYDGMDLPNKTCRMMLLSGLPNASHLQDRFLGTKLRATDVLLERVRSRVIQGAGRCTRGPKDWAVVVVVDEDLVRFLSRREVRAALPVELQAEIEFGLFASEVPTDELILLAESALEQDEIWHEDAEPALAQRRRAASRVLSQNATELAGSAALEVDAWTSAWNQDWDSAARGAVAVLERLSQPQLRPYRALWAYLGSAWSALAADEGCLGAGERAVKLLRDAHKASTGTTWLKEIEPLPDTPTDSEQVDQEAVGGVLAALGGALASKSKFDRRVSIMLNDLAKKSATPYEQALVALGKLLGAESLKPPGKGRADAAWVWDSAWMTLEAKSEQASDGALSMDYVRQANTQLDSLAADREETSWPEGSISVIITPRHLVDPDAVPIAAPDLYLTSPDLILDIAHDTTRAWNEIRTATNGMSGSARHETTAKIMWQHHILPTQIRERLSRTPIRGY